MGRGISNFGLSKATKYSKYFMELMLILPRDLVVLATLHYQSWLVHYRPLITFPEDVLSYEAQDIYVLRIDNGSSAEQKKRELRKMQMFSNAFFCDRKHHHDLVVLFQSFPSYLVRSIRHGLRLFICSSWSHNESDSFLFLNERIKYSRNSRELPTYTARVGGSPREGGVLQEFLGAMCRWEPGTLNLYQSQFS